MMTPEERFWSRVDRADDEACWTWVGQIDPKGYGRMWFDGGQRLAHRIAFALAGREVPDGLMIDHICHNRACVNLRHLRLVTNKENQEHRVGPGRANTSGYLDVSWLTRSGKWLVRVRHNRSSYDGGLFTDVHEAGRVARELRNRLFTNNTDEKVGA